MEPVLTSLAIAGFGWLGKNLIDPTQGLAKDLAPNLLASQVFDPLCRRLRQAAVRRIRARDGSRPRNHDVERAVRTAQLDADRTLVAAFARVAKQRNRPSDAAFARNALAWIDRELGAVGKLNVSDDVLDRMVAALDAPMTSDADLDAAAARAIQAAFLELEAGTGGDAPEGFADLFRTGDGGCPPWFEAFGDFLAEQIKTDQRFRDVLAAAKLAEMGAGVRRIEDLLIEREPVWEALRKATDDILPGLDRIEDKVDTLTAMVASMMADRGGGAGDKAALLAEIEQLRASGALSARAIEGFLKDVGETPLPPDQWPAQLAAFADRFRALLAELARRTNLPADLEAERTRALAAAEAGDLHGAETILAALTDRFAAWRRDQQEILDQGAREEASLLGDRAAIAKIGLRYRDAAELYAQAAAITPAGNVEDRWRRIMEQASALDDLGREFGDNAALLQAISLYRSHALPLVLREQSPLDWAMTQNNLANALLELGGREGGTARLEEAVTAFRLALDEYTRERVPLDWAMAQNNLAIALSSLGEREGGTTRLEEAIIAYRLALEEYTRERVPLEWAMTQNNLANALSELGGRESGTARLEEAVIAYRLTLEEYTRERVPLDWAMAQNNLANALSDLGRRESGTARLEEAVIAYRLALEERTRERVPLKWAMTQNNLASTLLALGRRENETTRLEEAVVAFRLALEEYTRERVPLDWAMTQNNLANALSELGSRERRITRVEEAVAAYRLALEERTRERVPLDWAKTQNNLASALLTLGRHESGTARLEEVVATYHMALEEYTHERVPLDWAMATKNLALAFEALFDKTDDKVWLDRALVAERSALKVYEEGNASYYAERSRAQIAHLEAKRRRA